MQPTPPQKGLLASLFDFEFSEFLLSRLVKLFYGLAVIGSLLFALVTLYQSIQAGGIAAVIAIVLIPVLFLAWVAWLRINLEVLVIIHRIAEMVGQILAAVQPTSNNMTDAIATQPESVVYAPQTPPATVQPVTPQAPPASAPVTAPAIECKSCASSNPADNAFCYRCGTPLVAQAPEVTSSVPFVKESVDVTSNSPEDGQKEGFHEEAGDDAAIADVPWSTADDSDNGGQVL